MNNAAVYSSNCSIFRAKKFEAKNTKEKSKEKENFKNVKVRFCLNNDVRKEKEDSWLNAIERKIGFVKQTEFEQQDYASSQYSPYGRSFI